MIPFYIITLKSTPERTVGGVAALLAAGVPFEWIRPHFGRDGADYENPIIMLDEACKHYDMSKYTNDSVHYKESKYPSLRGDIGCAWSHLEVLDLIIHGDEPVAYLNQDDLCLMPDGIYEFYRDPRPFPDMQHQLNRVLQNCDEKGHEFKCFHIYHKAALFPDTVLGKRFDKELPVGRGICQMGDSGLLLSPSGASELQNIMMEWGCHLEGAVKHGINAPGYYRSLTPARWNGSVIWDKEIDNDASKNGAYQTRILTNNEDLEWDAKLR